MTKGIAVLAFAAAIAAAAPARAQPSPPVDAVDAAARADYDDAFAALVRGELDRAAIAFDAVAARAQDPQLAAAAREMARLAHELVARKVTFVIPGGPGTAAPGPIEERDEGRTTFVVWTTMYGIYAGVVAIDDANITDFRVGIVTVTGTTALGLFGSLYATRDATMTGAMGDAYSLGMLEGFANAGLLVEPAGLAKSSEEVQTTLLLSGAAGAGVGLLYGYEVKPTRGQVSFASTMSLLGFASTGLGIGLVRPSSIDGNTALTMMAGGTDVGLAAGLSLGHDLDWSVSRGRIVELGALLGGLSGLAVGALITGANANTDDDTRILTGATLAGVWGGFAIAIRASEDMQADPRFGAPAVHVAPLALRGGAGLAVGGAF